MSIQGNRQSKELSCFYGGMTPPDQNHTYELHVFALDTLLDVKTGFFLNELYRKMDEHILSEYTLKGSTINCKSSQMVCPIEMRTFYSLFISLFP